MTDFDVAKIHTYLTIIAEMAKHATRHELSASITQVFKNEIYVTFVYSIDLLQIVITSYLICCSSG